MSFILASASPRRLQLLAQAGLTPDAIMPAEIDETPRKGEQPAGYVARLSQEKAESAGFQRPKAVILAADTTVAVGRRILGKPEDEAEARLFLELMSGRRHRVYTGICVMAMGKARQRVVMTQVQFKRLSSTEMEAFLASGEWQGVAGGYRIQGLAERYITAIHGSYSNVVGLPLRETCQLLESAGI